MSNISIRAITIDDREWVRQFLKQHWGASEMVSRGVVHALDSYPGFIASEQGEDVGLITYHIEGDDCEITSLDSTRPGKGIGSALIEAVRSVAQRAACKRVWLITTNDNLHALRFYQRRGFVLVALYPNSLAQARKLKPQIPLIGDDGIPLRDEIELALALA